LPVDPRALQHGDGASLIVKPGAQGEELVIGGAKVPPCGAHLTVIPHPAPTGCQLRRMTITPTTHRVHHVPDVDLLEGVDDNGENVSAPALRCVFPTCARIVSTWRGAASGSNCFLSGLQALSMSTVLWLTSLGSLYGRSRSGGTYFIRRGATNGCMDVSYPPYAAEVESRRDSALDGREY